MQLTPVTTAIFIFSEPCTPQRPDILHHVPAPSLVSTPAFPSRSLDPSSTLRIYCSALRLLHLNNSLGRFYAITNAVSVCQYCLRRVDASECVQFYVIS